VVVKKAARNDSHLSPTPFIHENGIHRTSRIIKVLSKKIKGVAHKSFHVNRMINIEVKPP
jgi:hypothetical protein